MDIDEDSISQGSQTRVIQREPIPRNQNFIELPKDRATLALDHKAKILKEFEENRELLTKQKPSNFYKPSKQQAMEELKQMVQ